eukprot:m.58872 g.58872  ORF g.58872 m.58872 type:complete len:77 (-) comp11729_c0_seq1:167-397(-)
MISICTKPKQNNAEQSMVYRQTIKQKQTRVAAPTASGQRSLSHQPSNNQPTQNAMCNARQEEGNMQRRLAVLNDCK